MDTLDQLKKAVSDASDADEAIRILDGYISRFPEDEEAHIMRGLKHWGAGHRAEAIKDYLAAIKINPESRARMALQAAEQILDYRNKDLYNP